MNIKKKSIGFGAIGIAISAWTISVLLRLQCGDKITWRIYVNFGLAIICFILSIIFSRKERREKCKEKQD